MSFLSQAFSFFVKEAPHLEQDLATLNTLTKQIRDMVSGLSSSRERDSALTALENVAMQGFQAIVAHGAAAPKAASTATIKK